MLLKIKKLIINFYIKCKTVFFAIPAQMRYAWLVFLVLIGITMPFACLGLQQVNVQIKTETLNESYLREHLKLADKSFLWKIQDQEQFLTNKLKKINPRVSNVTLTKVNANTVRLNVLQMKVSGYVLKNDQYYWVTATGHLSAKPAKLASDAPIIQNFKSQKNFIKIAKQIHKLPLSIIQNMSQVVWKPDKLNDERIIIFMNDGNTVYASLNDLDKKLKYYPEIAANMQKPGIVDLQFAAYSKDYKNN